MHMNLSAFKDLKNPILNINSFLNSGALPSYKSISYRKIIYISRNGWGFRGLAKANFGKECAILLQSRDPDVRTSEKMQPIILQSDEKHTHISATTRGFSKRSKITI